MDDRSFDNLTRALSGASPRRQVLRWVSGLLAGSVAGMQGRSAAAASCQQNSDCPTPTDPCKRAVCTDGTCVNRPLPKGVACGEQSSASAKTESSQREGTADSERPARDGAAAGDETPTGDGGKEAADSTARDGANTGDQKPPTATARRTGPLTAKRRRRPIGSRPTGRINRTAAADQQVGPPRAAPSTATVRSRLTCARRPSARTAPVSTRRCRGARRATTATRAPPVPPATGTRSARGHPEGLLCTQRQVQPGRLQQHQRCL